MYKYNEKKYKIYNLLLEKVKLYKEKKISLASIISDSEGLILAIDDLSEEFRDEFYNYWGVLEEIYAVNLERKRDINKREKKLIEKSICNIETMVKKILNGF